MAGLIDKASGSVVARRFDRYRPIMFYPFVITIILNTNRRKDTLECLASLRQNAFPNHRVIVLDNSSTDGSAKSIHSAFPEVEIIALPENHGYAGNNNVGIKAALDQGVDWVFVLNEDTILAPDCLDQLLAVGESDPSIGIVGPMVYHHDEPDVIQSAGGVMNRYLVGFHLGKNEPDLGQFHDPHPVDWISGCGIMVRRAVIEDVGLIDERFYYYVEEADWCLRAQEAGWQIVHVPRAKLWHKGVRRDYNPKPSVTYYATRNRLLLLSKHKASPKAWIAVWGFIFRTLVSWTVKPKWRSMNEHRNAMWCGAVDFLFQRWGQMP
jgi:GT2 family glycosyltransferase